LYEKVWRKLGIFGTEIEGREAEEKRFAEMRQKEGEMAFKAFNRTVRHVFPPLHYTSSCSG
jgi:hypothetical protein